MILTLSSIFLDKICRELKLKKMDDYSTKIKNSAEHLIRQEFPEKALELDTLVSVCSIHSNFNLYIIFYLSSEWRTIL